MRLEEQIYISFVRNVPFYKQIARYFRKKFVDGTYTHGGRLPASREIAAALEVHYNTVLKAYRLLREDKIIKMYARRRAWAENTGGWWMIAGAKHHARFEVKAAVREVLALGATDSETVQWLKDIVDEEVFETAKRHRQLLQDGGW